MSGFLRKTSYLFRDNTIVKPIKFSYNKCSSYSRRTHMCGELGLQNVGSQVTIAGWIQTKRLDKFILLRDRTGVCQVMMPEESELYNQLKGYANESVLMLKGVVRKRPEGQENSTMSSGQVEVELEALLETSAANPNLPFQQTKHLQPKEQLRLKYRYLDLRRPEIQYNLAIRSALTMKMRQFLVDKKFLDIETPTLFRRTPGGAKEFVVPTRTAKKFYSLVQSPQQFKQLLMVGGLDRYFQIARCYRDEGGKPDRQPEFTQLDIEMSFASREDIISLIEDLLSYCMPDVLNVPFEQMYYTDAMENYGVDKPDLRYNNKIQKFDSIFKDSGFELMTEFSNNPDTMIGGIFFDNKSDSSLKGIEKELKSILSDHFEQCKQNNETLIVSPYSNLDGNVKNSIVKKCNESTKDAIVKTVGENKIGFIVTGLKTSIIPVLGKLRTLLANNLLPDLSSRPNKFVWIIDFPLFLYENGQLEAAHHPFTAPHPEDYAFFRSDPLKCRSLHYDLVMNGQEVAGGSVRIHSSSDQKFVLEEVLKEDTNELSHLLDALDSGCPPHAGIAIGLDRLVAIITKADSIREVIAFPKSSEGRDLMGGAPSEISEEQKLLYHIEQK